MVAMEGGKGGDGNNNRENADTSTSLAEGVGERV